MLIELHYLKGHVFTEQPMSGWIRLKGRALVPSCSPHAVLERRRFTSPLPQSANFIHVTHLVPITPVIYRHPAVPPGSSHTPQPSSSASSFAKRRVGTRRYAERHDPLFRSAVLCVCKALITINHQTPLEAQHWLLDKEYVSSCALMKPLILS